jgi:hypothetical protein
MRRIRDERGRTSAGVLGVVVAAAFSIGALVVAGPGTGSAIKSGIEGAICRISGGSCESSPRVSPATRASFERAGHACRNGSIHDAYLEPLPESGLSRHEVRDRQNALVERIGRALRSTA